jgi:hypothetical protein
MANSYALAEKRLAWVNISNYRFPDARTITSAAGGSPELHRCKQQTWKRVELKPVACEIAIVAPIKADCNWTLENQSRMKVGRREGCAAQGLIPGVNLSVLGCVTARSLESLDHGKGIK